MPPFETLSVPASVMAPDVPVLGVRPVVPAEKVVTPLLMEEVATHVGTPPLIPRTYPLVPAAIEPKVLMPEKYGMAFGYFSSFNHSIGYKDTNYWYLTPVIVWQLSNDVDTWVNLKNGNKTAINITFEYDVPHYADPDYFRLSIREIIGGVEYITYTPYFSVAFFATYQILITKTGNIFTVQFYSGDILLASRTAILHSNIDFRYLSILGAYGAGDSSGHTLDVTRLDLQYNGTPCTCH